MKKTNHYEWLNDNLMVFFYKVGVECEVNNGIIVAHGDKCYGYKHEWAEAGIPFEHGVAIYLLSYLPPFNKQVRETDNGWIAPSSWVVNNYSRFKKELE